MKITNRATLTKDNNTETFIKCSGFGGDLGHDVHTRIPVGIIPLRYKAMLSSPGGGCAVSEFFYSSVKANFTSTCDNYVFFENRSDRTKRSQRTKCWKPTSTKTQCFVQLIGIQL